MKELEGFEILLKNLKNAEQSFVFFLDESFFKHFEHALIGPCDIEAMVRMCRKSDCFLLSIEHRGTVTTSCDRCAEMIDLPIEGSKSFVVKTVETPFEESDEVLYLSYEDDSFDVGPILYETVSLSLPMVNIYDCTVDDEAPCNEDVLKLLNQRPQSDQNDETVWQELKNLKL